MKLEDFYDRKRAFEEFKIMRNRLNEVLENPRGQSFITLFKNLKEQAKNGDVVAQDVVAYFYRDGVRRYLGEDYMKYMSWEIISAANGNKFAIDKLQFFLGYAYDEIVGHQDFGLIKYKNGIDEYNYIYIIGQKLCEQLMEELGLNAQTLAESLDRVNPYRPEYFRDLRTTVDNAIPKVIEKMKNTK